LLAETFVLFVSGCHDGGDGETREKKRGKEAKVEKRDGEEVDGSNSNLLRLSIPPVDGGGDCESPFISVFGL
jgi:hypothetical protein